MIRRFFLSAAGLILIAASAWSLANTAAAAEFSDVAIFATNSIALKSNVTVNGDVVVNLISPGPTIGPPNDFELSVDKKSSVSGDLTAFRIKIFQQATVAGDVFVDQLIDQGTINGSVLAFPSEPVFSAPPPFQPAVLSGGEQNVSVSSGQTVSLGADEYGDITIDAGGTLNFIGGVYNIRSIDAVGDDATISFDGATELRIAGKFRTRKDAQIGPSAGASIDASDIVLYVGGINGSDGALGSTPEAARVGSGSVVDANFYAPNGTFRAETNVVATGAFLGRDVRIDSRATVILDSFFFNKEPTLDAIPNPAAILEDADVQSVSLTGISAGGAGCLTPPNVCETQNLTVTATSDNPGLMPDPMVSYTSPNSTGSLSYAPVPDQNGTAVITVTVMDDGGTANGGDDTIVQTFSVGVIPLPDAPRPVDDSATVDEGGTVTMLTSGATSLLANDVEVDGETLTVSPSGSGAANGSVTIAADGTFSYTHDGSETTGDVFSYEACDPTNLCGVALVVITVNPVDDPPVADPQSVFSDGANDLLITLTGSTSEGTDLAFSVVSGPDPQKGSLGAVTEIVPAPIDVIDRNTGLPTGETIQPPITSATVTYTPTSGNNLEDSFTFQVENAGGVGMAVVTINSPDPSPPPPGPAVVEADDQSVDVTVNATVEIRLDGGAPDGVTLAFGIESLPTLGTLSDSAGGAIETVPYPLPDATVFYTAGATTGDDEFDFQARDTTVSPCVSPSPDCATATVFVGIDAQIELAEDQSLTTELNVPVLFTLAGNPGGSGTPEQKSLKALPNANIAGPVIDTDGDGFGDQAAIAQQFLGVDASTDSLFSMDRSTGTKTITGRLDAAATGGPNDVPNRYATPVSMAIRPSDATIFVRNNSELTTAGSNLLTNPEFELDPTNPANGWTAVGAGALSHDLGFGQPAAPSAFVENSGGQLLTLQQCVAITGGVSVDFSARSFTDLSTGSSTNSVSVSFFNSNDCTSGFLSNVPTSSTTFPDWALRTASGVAVPAGANSARIELAADSVGASDTMDIHWDNVMLAVSGGGSSVSRNELVTVDPDTGAATSLGDNTAGNGALAVDPSDNQLYSVGGSLETIDIVGPSVNITFVANTGVSCANADFDGAGNLYCTTLGSPALYQINKSTGAATLIGALLDVTGAPIDRSDSIVFAPDGTLLGSGLNPGQVLFDIDPGTAVISNVRSMNGLAQGMGFYGDLPEVMNAELLVEISETRSQIEFDIGSLQFDPEAGETATVELTTRRIGDDTEDTQFYVGTDVQDGALSPGDFEAPAVALDGVVMPIPLGSQAGDEGTFSFNVTSELKNAVDSSLGYFSVQGRVEGLDGIGLGVFTTASNNPPQLLIDVPVPQTFPQIKILTLPSAGIVKDLSGNAVMVGQTFAQPTDLVYSPPLNVSGTFSLIYQAKEGVLVDTGLVEFTIGPDECLLVGRPPGCSPDD